jgi:flagellar hook-associated protein FlgK
MIRNNPNELVESHDRMMRRLNAKMASTVGHRGDMYIADFKTIDQNGGHLLIGYERTIGPVGSNDVIAFVNKTFDGQIVPVMETAKNFKAEACVSVVVHRTVPTRKIEDKDQMLALANTMFLDQALGDTWEVKAQPDGTKYLSRISKDNIHDIVQERRSRMTVQASTMTFGTALSAGVPNLNKGDTVKFYDSGKLLEGKVTSVGAEVKIQSTAGSFTVMPEAVVEILQVSPETTNTIKSYLKDYFADAYGFEDYAKELTGRLT